MISVGLTHCIHREVVGIGAFPLVLSLHVLLNSKATGGFEIASTLVLPCFLNTAHLVLGLFWISHYCHQYYLHLTPPVATPAFHISVHSTY